MLGGAAAQSDGSDGRPARQFRAPPASEAPAVEQGASAEGSAPAEQPIPRRKAARTELPRGPKNIPWDEPGKRSGVPGVNENSATDLPADRTARAPRKAEKRPVRAAVVSVPKADEPAPARPHAEMPARKPDIPGTALGYAASETQHDDPRKVPVQVIRVAPQPQPASQSARAETAQPAPDPLATEARAKLIEQFRAKALADEQRRLQAEQSKDRHARRTDQAAQPRSKGDPEVTGAVTAAPDASPAAEQTTSGLKQGVCRLLLFNLVPGC
jgi:hypothetical protein